MMSLAATRFRLQRYSTAIDLPRRLPQLVNEVKFCLPSSDDCHQTDPLPLHWELLPQPVCRGTFQFPRSNRSIGLAGLFSRTSGKNTTRNRRPDVSAHAQSSSEERHCAGGSRALPLVVLAGRFRSGSLCHCFERG